MERKREAASATRRPEAVGGFLCSLFTGGNRLGGNHPVNASAAGKGGEPVTYRVGSGEAGNGSLTTG